MEPTEHNRRAWEEAHRRRAGSEPPRGLPDPVRRSLASLSGKRVLHLQCGIGDATLELAELGAVVTAVDPSEEALDIARERGPSIVWCMPSRARYPQSSVAAASISSMRARACWPRSPSWARSRQASWRPYAPGAHLLLYEEHPVALCVDAMMHWRENYFADDIRLWRLGQIVTALARAGLALRALEEYPARTTSLRRQDSRLPGEFLLHAVK